jgi:predicted nucleotidyltransferase
MTTTRWSDLGPARASLRDLPAFFPDQIWGERLSDDQQALGQNLGSKLMAIVKQIEERARDANALALILTGSTARGRRTEVSDLDFHVIGDQRLDLTVVPVDIEIYRDEKRRFGEKLEEGDDFAHWSVRFGRIVFDREGLIREAAEEVAGRDLWPDPDRKMRQASEALRWAEEFADSGDYGPTLEYSRTALSLVARGLLLQDDVFPLSRDEIPAQLRDRGFDVLAVDLQRTIYSRPEVAELQEALKRASQPVRSSLVAV